VPSDPSSNEPQPFGCQEALERVFEYLDGELTPEVERAIQAHLAECAECEPKFEHDRVFLAFISQRVRMEKAPPELRRRIMRELVDEATRRASE
jgi:mycothiol system anti-sigma-R factor